MGALFLSGTAVFQGRDIMRNWLAAGVLAVVVLCGIGRGDKLYEGFLRPDAEAKPFVRWWWNGNCVSREEIARELDLLKEAGIGGVEINPIAMREEAADTGAEGLLMLSPQWCRMVRFACEQAKERGMIADLIVGTGWPFGGPFVKPGHQIQKVEVGIKKLDGGGMFDGNVNDLMAECCGEFLSKPGSKPRLVFLRLVNNDMDDFSSGLELKGAVSKDGGVRFRIPPGENSLYVGVWKEGYREIAPTAPGGAGPTVDHYNEEAVRAFLEHISAKLNPYLDDKPGKYLRALFCDSLELAGANWTSDFPEEFEERRGYSIEPYLPFILSEEDYNDNFAETVERARYDFEKTIKELFSENFVEVYDDWCRRQGVLSRVQSLGFGHQHWMDRSLMVDIPEGETWVVRWDSYILLDQIRCPDLCNKVASSAAHLAGRRLVGCEAFTNTRGVFRVSPEYVKQAGDLSFMMGVNHLILHGFNYSPPEAGFPGWVRYGTYFSELNPWWEYFHCWAEYAARLSWVLQESKPCGNIAILGRMWQALNKNGYSVDYVTEDVIKGMSCEGGELRYGPMSYKALIIADRKAVEVETAKALGALAKDGARIIFAGGAPSHSPGLKNTEENDRIVRDSIRAALESDPDKVAVVEGWRGKDLKEWVPETLGRFGVEPAVEISPTDERLFQVHRVSDGRDIFLFANMYRDKELCFRAKFDTSNKTAWRWDAQTGRRGVYPCSGKKNELEIKLSPLESLLLVFEDKSGKVFERERLGDCEQWVDVKGPWMVKMKPVEGSEETVQLIELRDLSRDPRYYGFGGKLKYRTDFYVDEPIYDVLDVGEVHETAEVLINGKNVGLKWWGGRIFDIEGVIRPGKNVIEIKVVTTLYNYCATRKENAIARMWTLDRPRVLNFMPTGLVGPVRVGKSRGQ